VRLVQAALMQSAARLSMFRTADAIPDRCGRAKRAASDAAALSPSGTSSVLAIGSRARRDGGSRHALAKTCNSLRRRNREIRGWPTITIAAPAIELGQRATGRLDLTNGVLAALTVTVRLCRKRRVHGGLDRGIPKSGAQSEN
jgi:hypothetical protein